MWIVHRNLVMTNQVFCHSFHKQHCQYISFRRSRSHSFRGKHHVRSGPVQCFETHLNQTFSFLCILPFQSQSVGLSFSSVTYMWCCNMSRIFQRQSLKRVHVGRHKNPVSFHPMSLLTALEALLASSQHVRFFINGSSLHQHPVRAPSCISFCFKHAFVVNTRVVPVWTGETLPSIQKSRHTR